MVLCSERVRFPNFCLCFYLTESVYQVVLQNSIPTQIRQLIIYIRNSKGLVDGFVGELTSAKL